MQAQWASPIEPSELAFGMPEYLQYWAVRHATPLLMISADMTVIWCNDQGQAFRDRWPTIGIEAGRLFLSDRNRMAALRDFLAAMTDVPKAWVCDVPGAQFIIRIEPITPEHQPTAFFLTIHAMDGQDRYLWADMAAAFGLTVSENRVVKLLVSGLSVEALARELKISIETVRTHVRRVYAKLGVKGREQLFSAVLPYRLG